MNAAHLAVVVLTAAAAAVSTGGLATRRSPRVVAGAAAALVGIALLTGWSVTGPHDLDRWATVLAGVTAVAGGGIVTTVVFSFVEDRDGVREAGAVLRGGAWIGALERLGVFVALVAGWAPGLAVVLAVKGLGRYPELRSQDDPGVAERFIIGTFTSVLWAVACAGVAVLSP